MKLKVIYCKDTTLYPSKKIALGIAHARKEMFRRAGWRNALEIQTRYERKGGGFNTVVVYRKEKKLKQKPRQAPKDK